VFWSHKFTKTSPIKSALRHFFSRFSSTFVQTRPLLSKTCELSSETRLLSLLFSLVFHLRRSTPTDERSPPLRHSFFRLRPRLRAHHAHSAFFHFCLHLFTHPLQLPHAQPFAGEGFTPIFPSPCASPAAPLAPSHDRGQKWPKAVKTGAQGEAFTRNILYFKRLCVNRREHTRGEAFTRNTLTLNILQAKGEEVKAKSRKTPDARVTRTRWAVAARRPAPFVGRGRKNVPRRTALPRKYCNFAECAPPLLTNMGAPPENVPV